MPESPLYQCLTCTQLQSEGVCWRCGSHAVVIVKLKLQ